MEESRVLRHVKRRAIMLAGLDDKRKRESIDCNNYVSDWSRGCQCAQQQTISEPPSENLSVIYLFMLSDLHQDFTAVKEEVY